MHVFTTPTCPHCSRAVTMAHEMAYASPHVRAYAVEAEPSILTSLAATGQLASQKPSSTKDQILGALPEEDFVNQAPRQIRRER